MKFSYNSFDLPSYIYIIIQFYQNLPVKSGTDTLTIRQTDTETDKRTETDREIMFRGPSTFESGDIKNDNLQSAINIYTPMLMTQVRCNQHSISLNIHVFDNPYDYGEDKDA